MKIIRIGLGEIVVTSGKSNGKPAIIIEPSKEQGAAVGDTAPRENYAEVMDDSVVLEIHDVRGLEVILNQIFSSLQGDVGWSKAMVDADNKKLVRQKSAEKE